MAGVILLPTRILLCILLVFYLLVEINVLAIQYFVNYYWKDICTSLREWIVGSNPSHGGSFIHKYVQI